MMTPASGWAESVRFEVLRLGRIRTTKWAPWREAGSYRVPRPVVFDATVRLIPANREAV